jgi:hypothetical protein
MGCSGNSKDHCCWLNNKPCKYLEVDTVPDRKWACGLRRRFGDWDTVLESPEYQRDIEPYFGPIGINCKDWPDLSKGQYCGECGYGT